MRMRVGSNEGHSLCARVDQGGQNAELDLVRRARQSNERFGQSADEEHPGAIPGLHPNDRDRSDLKARRRSVGQPGEKVRGHFGVGEEPAEFDQGLDGLRCLPGGCHGPLGNAVRCSPKPARS